MRSTILAAFVALDQAVRPAPEAAAWRQGLHEFLVFGIKQARACLFGALMLTLIVATRYLWPHDAPLHRYDFLTLSAVAIQIALIAGKVERLDEALVILVFHVLGTAMEVFKTARGSWIYPEDSLLHIGGVPLFSGFMYASIGSYIARIWRLFEVRFSAYPTIWATWVLAIAAYINFFTHHFAPDIRLGLFALTALLFGRTWFWFRPDRQWRRMPMLLGMVLVALFIWIAENLGTFASAWIYPNQRAGWSMVPIGKLGAWYLLMMLSFVLVTAVRRPRPQGRDKPPSSG